MTGAPLSRAANEVERWRGAREVERWRAAAGRSGAELLGLFDRLELDASLSVELEDPERRKGGGVSVRRRVQVCARACERASCVRARERV